MNDGRAGGWTVQLKVGYARVQWYGGVHVGVRVACLVSSFVVGLVLDGCVW